MQVSGREYQLLVEALVDAFDFDTLEAMLQYGTGERLDVLVGRANLRTTAFKLVEVFRQRDQVERLVQAARRYNPTNDRLYAVAQTLGLATQVAGHTADGVMPSGADLEKMVRQQVPMLNARAMRAQMMRVEGLMCVVERRLADGRGEAQGSGFLVGLNTVLTNYHVVEDFLAEDQAQQLQVRFDALLRADGVREPEEGVVFAVEAIPASRPYTLLDPGNATLPPAADELDFAILQLAGDAGQGQVGGFAGGLQKPAERGWLPVPDPAPVPAVGDPLIIYQYPGGRELMLAIDTEAVVGTVWDGLRLRYRNNTERGSSGSPVFTLDWELVALHHVGGPGPEPAMYNQGVPLARIAADLAARQMGHLLGE